MKRDKKDGKIYLKSNLNKLQAVLFVKSLDLSNPLSLAVFLKEDKGLPFDGPETVLPVPPDAPLGIPRIILKSNDGVFGCNVSANRIDLSFNETGQLEISPEEVIKKVKRYLEAINKGVQDNFDAKPHRIAVVADTVTKLKISSKEFLKKRYLKEGVAKKVFEAQLNFLSKGKLGDFKINKWLRINTLRKKTDPKDDKDDKAVQIIFDINTLQEIDYDISSRSINQFVDMAYKEINSSIKSILEN